MDIADKIRTLIQERDYYKNKYEELKAVIESAITDTTKPEVHEEVPSKGRAIRGATYFNKLNINIGDVVYLMKDPNIMFTVIGESNEVRYNGIEYSLSKIVTLVLQSNFGYTSSGVNGFQFVSKDPHGKSLWELRKEMEAAGTYGNQVQPKLNEDDEDLAEFF